MASDFPFIAFQSSLAIEGILFGVFGFLYSVFGAYSAQATPTSPQRPPVIDKLRTICRFIALLVILNVAIIIDSLAAMHILQLGIENIVLAGLLILTMFSIALFSLIWAFHYMD